MTIQEYIETISKRLKSGISREHSYRGDLETLIRDLVKGIEIINEPANVTNCGNPDYVITNGKIPVGYIEAKDIGKDLNHKAYKEQFDRYRKALDNLIITDYLWFQFYQSGELVHEIRIGEIVDNKGLQPLVHNFARFENLIQNFCTHIGQTIKSSQKLAEMMASKARLLQNILERAITSDEETQENTSLQAQYETFKTILIHDLTPQAFADIYAQTLAYGMFAARLHDKTLDDFSRQEAAELIPKSNPFLRKLFAYVAGPDIDERIVRTVDNLADVFRATNVKELLKNFGKSTQTHDPIIHFYETFLSEYDPKLRKARGVWYTPEPVVNFIVRAVDDILKTEFGLPQGLADTTKAKIKVPVQTNKGLKPLAEKEVHKVQILDPATGTGTFLAEVAKHIYNTRFKAMQGAWSGYVEEHLIPRLNGFELLMASYAMAHLKLDMLLSETGYKATKNQRFNIYLTNSLEEHHPDTGTLFSQWLSTEANEANHIKRDTPVMCVIGNPPYSVSSSNKSEWVEQLMKDYKKDLNERNIQPLSDDYIKFIRLGEHYINKTGEGILAYISNNSFIDGIIHRQMRKHLLESFDKVYILDLHGNSKKKETAPDGTPDQNVFDIMQGVSISIFVKTTKKKKGKLGEIYHYDFYGKRNRKNNFLHKNSLSSIKWNEPENRKPEYFFVKKDTKELRNYVKGFKINVLFLNNASGIKTQRDDASIKFTKKECEDIKNDFLQLTNNELIIKYGFKDVRDWKIDYAKSDLSKNKIIADRITYRPFDFRYMNYTGKTKGVMGYPRYDIMKHLLETNIALLSCRQQSTFNFQHVFVSKYIADMCSVSLQTKETGYIFPLYLYQDKNQSMDMFAGIEEKKIELQYKLEQAKEHFEQVSTYFHTEVEPFFEELENPDETNISLFEENKSLYEESQAAVEQLKTQINRLSKKRQQQIAINSEIVERIPNLNMKIVEEIEEKLGLEFVAEKNSPPLEGCPQDGVEKQETVCTINNIPIKRNFISNLPANPALNQRAKDKRKAGILSEVLFWKQVHKKKFHAIDFDRQRVIGNYIVDFYVKSLGLAVEIDGSSHDNKEIYDSERQKFIEKFGVKVYRIKDIDVKKNINKVMQDLERYIVEVYGDISTPPGGHPSKGGEFAPIDLLDYIYAVLHSPTYREKYKEFLKIDFPRVPYPKNAETFWQLVKLGGELRQIHLLESPKVEEYITGYPIDGNNQITTKIAKKDWEITTEQGVSTPCGRIWINDQQYFDNIPLVAWEFYIGGYQPAQKWLKDRAPKKGQPGRTLSFEDILHYQKIIVALTETDRLMKEIDKIEIE